MMEVAESDGPKPGRRAFRENKDITFRQLVGNTSGYMTPGEPPGRHFHYQTYGTMIRLCENSDGPRATVRL